MATRDIGQAGEAAAREHLERAGLVTLAANVNYRFGELDLVMRDGNSLVFVEVRLRRNTRFGGGLASVTAGKRRRIALAASAFLAANPQFSQWPCRFDVVALTNAGPSPHIEWIKAAFTLDDAR